MRGMRMLAVAATLLTAASVAISAPEYLIDARDWNGTDPARLVVRAIPEMTRPEALSGRVAVEGGELIDLRARSREGRASAPGVTVDGAGFTVEAGQPMHDLAIEFTGTGATTIALDLGGESVQASIAELRADDRTYDLQGGGTARLLLTFVYPSENPAPITQLKPILSATELMVGGTPRCVIAAPRDGRYDRLAQELAATLAQHGTAPEVVDAEELVDEHFQPNSEALAAANVIAIGNVLDNQLAARLSGSGQAMASQLYPGPGGYVIRTVHDPFGLGRNVVLLAGSDADGVGRAVARFVEAYVPAQGDVVLAAPVVDVKYVWVEHPGIPPAWPKRMPPVRDMAYLQERLAGAGVMNEAGEVLGGASVGGVVDALTVLGETWWYLGWPELPPLMGQILEQNVSVFDAYQALPPHEMSSGITPFTAIWDLIEELPVFTDSQRLAVTNALLAQARLGHEPRSMHVLVREGCRQVHDENHGTNSALNDLVPWRYFDLYYDLPDADYWLTMADALFRGQASSFQISEDSASYNAGCPDHAMSYAFSRPHLLYLERGVARHIADYFLSSGVNNLGFYSGFGDTSGLVPVGYFNVLSQVLFYTRDGRYRWALESLLHRNSGLGAYTNRAALRDDVAPVEPTDLTGILLEPIYERVVEKGGGRLEPIYLPEEPVGGSYNKVAMREAWGADRQYLLMSGMQRDGHTQAHVNAIINLTDNGKMWLIDHEYGLRLAADHSGIVGMHNGRFINPGRQAIAASVADFDRCGMVSSTVGMGALSWKRSVLWLKGGWYAVLDDLSASESGEYVLRAAWRGLGGEELKPDRMVLTQQDQRYEVVTDGQGDLDLQVVPFASGDEWVGFYPGADPAAKVLRQDRVLNLEPGDGARFATLLMGYGEDAPVAADVAALADGAAVVRSGGERWVVADGPVQTDAITFDGAGAMVGPETIAISDATSLSVGGEELLQAAEPVSLQIDLRTGRTTLPQQAAGASFTWRGRAMSIGEAAGGGVDTDGLANAIARALATASEVASALKQQALAGTEGAGYEGLSVVSEAQLSGPATTAAMAGEDLAVGLVDGTVALVGPDDSVRWTWQGAAAVTALAAADLDGDGALEIIAGTQDGLVSALDGGDVRWQFEVRGSDTANYRYAKSLVVADLEGDGSPEILAVAPFLHCLRADGTQAWEEYFAHWRNLWRTNCGVVHPADLDGDGRMEIVSSWIDGYSGTRVLRADGEPVAPVREGDDFSPKVNHGKPTGVIGVDFNADGRGDVAVGYDGGIVTFPFDTEATVGVGVIGVGPVLHLLQGRSAEHDPLLIATNDMADVRGVYHSASDTGDPYRLREAWRVSVGAPITAAITTDLTGDGLTETIVGTRRGSVAVISSEGETIGEADVNASPVTAICVAGDGPDINVIRADGAVQRLRPAR